MVSSLLVDSVDIFRYHKQNAIEQTSYGFKTSISFAMGNRFFTTVLSWNMLTLSQLHSTEKEQNHDTITQIFSRDTVLCLLCQWAALVHKTWNYPGATINTPVLTVWRNSRIEHIISKHLVKAIQAAIKVMGEDVIGFLAEKLGYNPSTLEPQ